MKNRNSFEDTAIKKEIRQHILDRLLMVARQKKKGDTLRIVTLPGMRAELEAEIVQKYLVGTQGLWNLKIEIICFENQQDIYFSNVEEDYVETRVEAVMKELHLDPKTEITKANYPDLVVQEIGIAGANISYRFCNLTTIKRKVDFAWLDFCGIASQENIDLTKQYLKSCPEVYVTFSLNLRCGTAHSDLPKKPTCRSLIRYFSKTSNHHYTRKYTRPRRTMVTLGFSHSKKDLRVNELDCKVQAFATVLLKQGFEVKQVAEKLHLNPNRVRAWKAWLHPVMVSKQHH